MAMLNMMGAGIGISSPLYAIPSLRMSSQQLLSPEHPEFTFDDVLKYWPSGQIEQELVFEYLATQTAQSRRGDHDAGHWSDRDATSVYVESSRTTCTMALEMARLLLATDNRPTRKIQTLIYYSSTMSTKTAWSTPCRLQSELQLRGTDAFAVSQKGAISSFAALHVAAAMLLAEDRVRNVLLVGSERLIPPYQRKAGSLAVQSDSASAMFVSRTVYDFQICAVSLDDPAQCETTLLPGIDTKIRRLLHAAEVAPEEITLVLPAHLNHTALIALIQQSTLPREAFYTKAVEDVGSLGSSDLVAGLRFALTTQVLRPGDLIVAFGLSAAGSLGCCLLRYQPYEEIL
jgi:3-oxoacyl-[acyl-carrier-protein] synthase III